MTREFDAFKNLWPSGFSGRYTQLNEFLTEKQLALLKKSDAARAEIDSAEKLQAYAKKMRETFIEKLGGIPERNCPLDAKIVKTMDRGTYMLESILFKSREGIYVTSTMYIPKNLEAPAASILFLSGHSDNGRMSERYQGVCIELVNAGLVVFAIDPPGQGERKCFYDPAIGKSLPHPTLDHDLAGIPALCSGRSIGAYFMNEQYAAVDYMLTRKEVDPARIGVTGCSGGGLQSLYMMTCDERIAAAAPATFPTTRREILFTNQSQDAEQIWPGCADYGFDHFEPFAIFAPKPAIILTVESDFFPIEGGEEVYQEAKRLYGLYGKSENLEIFTDRECHGYTPALAVKAAEFFTRVFGVEKRESAELNPLPDAEIQITRTGNVCGDFADAIAIPAENVKLAASMRENRRFAEAKAWLTERVNFKRVPRAFRPRVDSGRKGMKISGYTGKGVMWYVQERLTAWGALIFKGESDYAPEKPTVIALWDNGTQAIGEHEEWIKAQCDAGKQVLVVDLPGVGAIEQAEIWTKNSYRKQYGTMYKMCCDLIFMDDSMAAMQTYHVLRTIDMLKECFNAPEVSLYCDENEGVYGVMAGWLSGEAREYGEKLLTSVEKQIVEPCPFEYDNTLSYIIPGMLKYFDYSELM